MDFTEIIEKSEKKLRFFIRRVSEDNKDFPSWDELTNVEVTNDFICRYTQIAQNLSFTVTDSKVWVIKLRMFKTDQIRRMASLSRDQRATFQFQIDQLKKIEENIKDVTPCLQDRYFNTLESLKSLKLMSKTLIE